MEQAVGQRRDATSAAAERAHRETDADRGDHPRSLGRYARAEFVQLAYVMAHQAAEG
jgi:hypothetical protein